MRVLLFGLAALLFVGLVFFQLIKSSDSVSHIHFTTRAGVLKNVVYYSSLAPETAEQHQCDGEFAEMMDHLYETHLQLWQEQYQRR